MPENLPAEIDRAIRQPIAVNSALNTTSRQGQWNFQPDRPLTSRQEFDPYNVWYRSNGGVVQRSPSAVYEVGTDPAQADSRARLETADLGLYQPGVTATVSGGVWIDVQPQDDAQYTIGYGAENGTETLNFLVDSDETLKFEADSERYVNGPLRVGAAAMEAGNFSELTDDGDVVAEVYGLSQRDGLGPKPSTWRSGRGYLYGITLGWYGPTSIMPWWGAIGDHNGRLVQRAWPLALIRPVGGPLVQKPNRPWHVTANNKTSGQDLRARIGGRQFANDGEVQVTPAPSFDFAVQQTSPETASGEGDWSVVGVLRRKQGNQGVAMGVSSLEVVPQTADIAVQVRVVDPQYLSGVSYSAPVDVAEQQTALETDLESDTPDRVTLDTATIDGSTKLQGVAWTGGVINSGRKSTGRTRLDAGFDFPLVRNFPTVVLATPRTANSVDVATAVEVLEKG